MTIGKIEAWILALLAIASMAAYFILPLEVAYFIIVGTAVVIAQAAAREIVFTHWGLGRRHPGRVRSAVAVLGALVAFVAFRTLVR